MKRSILLLCILGMMACKRGAEPIDYGHDACAHCKMTIMDNRYAAEMVTSKGKAFKFDDVACLLQYMAEDKNTDALYFISDYNNPDGQFLDARSATYLQHDLFKSPMRGKYAAFASTPEATHLKDSLNIDLLKWEELKTNHP